ncbi:sulfite exporter TauE/SafE family protein [Candidatus Solincola sp.]|nr:sulfite exporter TauE/SafE family protein [Actinomycetota bacterium]MDI7252243.1 sulfite exporter TauE/SafE family protein [Actinomycetota bacterium]
MQAATISLAVFAVSFVFSMMGAGGSQILVPILFWLGLDFKAGAIPLGLLVASVTCFSAGLVYYRRGLVRLSTGWPFALAVLLGSPLGALLARPTSSRTLMIAFAVVNILVGLLVLRGRSLAGEGLSRRKEVLTGLLVGLGIGFMIGFIARDGGPFTMAVLVLMGLDAREAAGTAPFIVAAGCLVAFLVHAFGMSVEGIVLAAALPSALVASQLGARFMSRRLESRTVRLLFTAVMVVVGVVILVQAL